MSQRFKLVYVVAIAIILGFFGGAAGMTATGLAVAVLCFALVAIPFVYFNTDSHG